MGMEGGVMIRVWGAGRGVEESAAFIMNEVKRRGGE